MSKTSITFLILFVIALVTSIFLSVSRYSLGIMLKDCKEAEEYIIEERDFLFELIPNLDPQATKKDFVKVIMSKYPKERVDELDNLVRWRFFKFWFGPDGELESVTYGS